MGLLKYLTKPTMCLSLVTIQTFKQKEPDPEQLRYTTTTRTRIRTTRDTKRNASRLANVIQPINTFYWI